MTGWKSPGRRLPMKGVSTVKARQIFGKGGGDIHECERVIYLFSLRSCPPQLIRWFLMSEVIIIRRGGGGSSSASRMITQTFVKSGQFIVPNHIGNIDVRLFGGGYGDNGGFRAGGGGGYGHEADGGTNGGGGGGYFSKGGSNYGGGGGYGDGGNEYHSGKFGGGVGTGYAAARNSLYGGDGGDGICIIQYYI